MPFPSYFNFGAGNVVRCNNVVGAFAGTINPPAVDSSILGGPLTNTHTVNTDCSTVVMGNTNSIFAFLPATPGGYNSIVNGKDNSTTGFYASIFSGNNNIAGGGNALACYPTVINGGYNAATGDFSFISNGGGFDAATATPLGNSATGDFSFIGNGILNQATGIHSYIGNGGGYSLVGSCGNQAIGDFSFIGNGICNHTDGCFSFIGNGSCNNIFVLNPVMCTNSIVNGWKNTIEQTCVDTTMYSNTIAGGQNNTIRVATCWADASTNFIGSGNSHLIQDVGNSAIVAGGGNTICSPSSFIGTASQSCIFDMASLSAIVSGESNCIFGGINTLPPHNRNFIGAGVNNGIQAASSFIGAGMFNKLIIGACGVPAYSFIGAGLSNCILDLGWGNMIGAGRCNFIEFDSYAAIVSGCGNTIFSESNNSFIGAGENNTIGLAAGGPLQFSSVIGGGCANTITGFNDSVSHYSFIGGGHNNCLEGARLSAITGGEGNMIRNQVACTPAVNSEHNFIGGGSVNLIDENACHNAIAGGNVNQVINSSFTFIGSGQNNRIQTISNNSFIGGGEDNLLGGGDQRHSFIGGGHGNVISGRCSAILGGQNNNVNHNYAAAFGNGVNSVMANAFHTEEIVLTNIPVIAAGGFGSLQPGQLYTCSSTLGYMCRPVFIV